MYFKDRNEAGSLLTALIKPLPVEKVAVTLLVALRQVAHELRSRHDTAAHCLRAFSDFLGVGHYYEHDDRPTKEQIEQLISNVTLGWI